MIKVAVTGGIGSGKSVVCKIFEKIGIPVFNADFEAKKLINTSRTIHDKLVSLFGAAIYQSNGDIHRKKMADLIFNDNFALQKVNEIVHPEVRNSLLYFSHLNSCSTVRFNRLMLHFCLSQR